MKKIVSLFLVLITMIISSTDVYAYNVEDIQSNTYLARANVFSIESHPADITVNVGEMAHFKIVANGSGNTYQWQYKLAGTNEWRTPGIASAKTTDYSFEATEQYNGLKVRCNITNAAGTTVSNEATLTVNSKPVITSQPANVSVSLGETAHFKIAANGSGNKYQWQYKLAGTNEWRTPGIASAKTTDYSFEATEQYNGLKVRCNITNAAGTTVSNEATLAVNSKPVITSQPSNTVAKVGDTVHFKIAANGSGNKYQWQYKLAGTNEWRTPGIASARTTDYSFEATEQYNGLKVRCNITNAAGTTVSYEANLTVIKSEDWELPIM